MAKACVDLGYADLYICFEEGGSVNGTREKPATLKTVDDVCLCRWWLDVELGNPVMRFIVQPMHPDLAVKLAERGMT